MKANDLLEELRRKPFQPLRLVVSDGTTYEIRHPEQCMVGWDSSVIGVANDPKSPPFDRMIGVDNNHIVTLEPIAPIAPFAGGITERLT